MGGKLKRAAVPVALAVAVVVAICILTVQPPEATVAQSEFAGKLLAGLLAGFPGAYDPTSGELLGTDIRRWAHVAEFGALGLAVAVAACRMVEPRRARAAGAAAAVCASCSLLDQCHKLLVPGRHFDAADLAFDALGYGLAIVLVLSFACLWHRR